MSLGELPSQESWGYLAPRMHSIHDCHHQWQTSLSYQVRVISQVHADVGSQIEPDQGFETNPYPKIEMK